MSTQYIYTKNQLQHIFYNSFAIYFFKKIINNAFYGKK